MRRILVVLAFALLLLGSACSEESNPIIPSPSHPIVTPSPSSPVVTPPPSSPAATPSQVPVASIEDAIEAYLALENIEYAGECATTDYETDIGKYCSTVTENNGDTATAIIGPTYSEYVATLTLTRTGGGWAVTDAVPIEYPDVP